MTAKGTYGNDPVTDLGWPLGFALLALAACVPTEPATAQRRAAVCRRRWSSMSLPYLPIIPGVAVFVSRSDVRGRRSDPFLGVVGQRRRGPARRAPGA